MEEKGSALSAKENMDLLPAIDLKDQKVVRLTRGDYAQVTVYSEDPLEVAQRWIDAGAEWLHIVDLDAALEGKPVNFPLIQKIGKLLQKQGKKFEIGGGVRHSKTLSDYIDEAGADRVILGTIAYQDPNFVKEACKNYSGKIAVGIDVKDGKVATQGWTEVQNLSASELAQKFETAGVSCIVYTDIQRDGMLSGLNFKGLADFAAQTSLPVIAAGGLKDMKDVTTLLSLTQKNIVGAVTGKAIYEGSLDLKKAFEALKGRPC